MKRPETKITRRRRRNRAGGPLTTLLAFGLLCAGVLLLSERTVGPPVRAEDQTRRDVLSDAIEATRHAERAFDDENYGEARAHLARVRLDLEHLTNDDPTN